jgi:hypothetical protein
MTQLGQQHLIDTRQVWIVRNGRNILYFVAATMNRESSILRRQHPLLSTVKIFIYSSISNTYWWYTQIIVFVTYKIVYNEIITCIYNLCIYICYVNLMYTGLFCSRYNEQGEFHSPKTAPSIVHGQDFHLMPLQHPSSVFHLRWNYMYILLQKQGQRMRASTNIESLFLETG